MYTAGMVREPAVDRPGGLSYEHILVVRLGAMGDIIHTLPAVAALKQSQPGARLTWVVEPKWAPLLDGNPFVDRIVLLRRESAASLLESWRDLRTERYDFAIDFQGLLKSALVAAAARPARILGFEETREAPARLFYSDKTTSASVHVVDRNLDLAGGLNGPREFPLPAGKAEGELPRGRFILASPLAGWRSKQWPVEHYAVLGARIVRELGIPLVLNVPPGAGLVGDLARHCSGLAGLIHATHRAAAVIGVDSGPMHLAAALRKPGVAIFGPTDPARHGPYSDSFRVLRAPGAITTYKRGSEIDESMRRVSPDEVFETLRSVL